MNETPEPLCELLPYRKEVVSADVLVKFSSGQSFESALDDLSRGNSGTPLRDFVGLKFVCGDPETAAIFALDYSKNVITPGVSVKETVNSAGIYVQPELLEDVLKIDMVSPDLLADWLRTFRKPRTQSQPASHTSLPRFSFERTNTESLLPQSYREYSSSLRAGLVATEIYKLLPDATISTTVVSQSLWLSKWLPAHREDQSHLLARVEITRALAFACIAMFESGSCNLDPAGLQEAFALASGNSIYVAAPLLCDPFEVPAPKEIRRVTGSIGRPGITVLVPPGEPKCRARNDESWFHVNHLPFDGKLENCFQHTTIHLAFTAYELPLSDGTHGEHIIDRPASLVETVVSVHDRGEWIADLDVLSALNQRKVNSRHLASLHCGCRDRSNKKRKATPTFEEIFATKAALLMSIDNWDEFLDLPSGSVLVVRAYQNWLARLAFTVMSVNEGQETLILPEDICWLCCKEALDHATHEGSRSSVLIC